MFESLLTRESNDLYYVNSIYSRYLYEFLRTIDNIDKNFLDMLGNICNLEFEYEFRIYFRYTSGYYEYRYIEFDNSNDSIKVIVNSLGRDKNTSLLYTIKDANITESMNGKYPGIIIYKDELWKR